MSLLISSSHSLLVLLALALLSPISVAAAITYTTPTSFLERASIFLVSVTIAAQLQYDNPDFTGNSTYNGFLLSWMWIYHLRVFKLLFKTADPGELSSAVPITNSQIFEDTSKASQLVTAWSLIFSFRDIKTLRAIKNTQSPAGHSSETLPTKSEFVKSRIAEGIWLYLLADAIFTFLPDPDVEVDVPEYKQAIFSRLGDITLEEIIARPISVAVPAFCIYAIFTIPYNIFSIIAVLFLGSAPQSWPTQWGSLTEAYTLRRFWGLAWHQTFRSCVESSSSFISTDVLRISPSRHRLLSRTIRLFLAFYISALVHIPGNVALGQSPFNTSAPTFFVMQALGITIESFVYYWWSYMTKTRGLKLGESSLGKRAKVFGYLWTAAWLTWTGPSWMWTTARGLVPGRDVVVPWSLFKQLPLGGLLKL
jgi:hypothetical protein